MSTLEPTLERQMRRAQARWRWLRFWRLASALGFGLAGGLLALGLAMHGGALRHPAVVALVVLVLLLAVLAGFVTIVAFAAASRHQRRALARAIERVWEPFEDRLNTLVSLEGRAADPEVAPYFRRIQRQARILLPAGALPSPFPAARTLLLVVGAVAALGAVAAFFSRYEPWDRLSWEDESVVDTTPPEPDVPELPPPNAADAEVRAPWGEVRITEPGRDLKVTKVDVVPLQVEAATDQTLSTASWFTGVGGGKKAEHRLPPPQEPNYAVYEPLLYVDELRLQDWDVVTYYASAGTRDGRSYASEVYFLEVRPFREDILKVPGGEGGKAYAILNKLTGLIERQRQILRETHRHQQQPRPADLEAQDRSRLVEAESELSGATRHLYAEVASKLENQPVGEVLTHLSRAEERMDEAVAALSAGARDATAKEQDALTELVSTRKAFHKAISENPGAFSDDDPERDPVVVADPPDKLKQILELRDEQKAAREAVREALEEQKRIAEKAKTAAPGERQELAEEQEAARLPLEQVRAGAPQAFKGAEKEADEATGAMKAAAEALRGGAPDAAQVPSEAVGSLARLQRSLDRQRSSQDLADAYRLKEVLDRQAEGMGRMAGSPESFSDRDARRAAEEAKSTAEELEQIVTEDPVREAFGPGLSESLSGEPRRRLEEALGRLGGSQGPAERGQAAGEARAGLDRVRRAFDESQPQAVKDLKADRLKPSGPEALDRALELLESLVTRGEAGRSPSPEDEARQRRELILHLEEGLERREGRGSQATALLLRAKEALHKEITPEEKAKLKQLAAEIEHFRAEQRGPDPPEAEASATHVDPSRLPATYRDRIQRYFRKLSEQ